MASVYAVPVLAGAYKGKDISQRSTLYHAVSDEAFTSGKLSRGSGEAFCKRNIPGLSDDSYSWDSDTSKISCPKCLEVLGRITADGGV